MIANEWSVYRAGEEPSGWWDEWDRLLSARSPGHPILCSMFARLCVQHFGNDRIFFVIQSTASGNTRAMALVERSGARRIRVFMPSQAPLPFMIVSQDGCLRKADVVQLLRVLKCSLGRLEIAQLDPEMPVLHESMPESCMDKAVTGTTIIVRVDRPFNDYWAARPKQLRADMARYLKRARHTGARLALDEITDPQRMDAAVREYAELESLGWKAAKGTALRPGDAQCSFYSAIMTSFAQNAQATALLLRSSDQLIAARLVIRGESMAVVLKTTYLESARNLAPGRINLYLMLQSTLASQTIKRIEFFTRANRDTLNWADESREMAYCTVYASAMVCRCIRGVMRLRSERAVLPVTNQ